MEANIARILQKNFSEAELRDSLENVPLEPTRQVMKDEPSYNRGIQGCYKCLCLFGIPVRFCYYVYDLLEKKEYLTCEYGCFGPAMYPYSIDLKDKTIGEHRFSPV